MSEAKTSKENDMSTAAAANPCKPHRTEYVVRESSAPNKSSWKWRHRRVNVAVLHVDAGATPAMISARARGVREIVSCLKGLYDGSSSHCQAAVARREAEDLAARLNDEIAYECRGRGSASCC